MKNLLALPPEFYKILYLDLGKRVKIKFLKAIKQPGTNWRIYVCYMITFEMTNFKIITFLPRFLGVVSTSKP